MEREMIDLILRALAEHQRRDLMEGSPTWELAEQAKATIEAQAAMLDAIPYDIREAIERLVFVTSIYTAN